MITNHAEETLPRFQESKKFMEAQQKLLAEYYGAKRDLSKGKGAFEHKFHGAKRALENSQALLSNGDKHISILEKMLTTATFAKKLAEKLLELQEECFGLGSQPEGHEKKMASILTRLNECYVETAGSMEELNKTRDGRTNLVRGQRTCCIITGRYRKIPKRFRRTKVEAELLKKKKEIAAKRQARKEK